MTSNSSNALGNQSPSQDDRDKGCSSSYRDHGRGDRGRGSSDHGQEHQVPSEHSFNHDGFSEKSPSGISNIPLLHIFHLLLVYLNRLLKI